MNKMKILEERFFFMYPEGFDSEEMKVIEKKHKLDKLSKMAHDMFSVEAFHSQDIVENFKKIVNASTLVSRFEKPGFKSFIDGITDNERILLKDALFDYLHGDEEEGFEKMVQIMLPYKTAKWPILTILKAYYHLDDDIFIKPTTVKMILKYFDSNLKYTSKPNYQFYNEYRTF